MMLQAAMLVLTIVLLLNPTQEGGGDEGRLVGKQAGEGIWLYSRTGVIARPHKLFLLHDFRVPCTWGWGQTPAERDRLSPTVEDIPSSLWPVRSKS